MATPLTHRATAVKGKYLAQAAGLVLLAAGAAVWAVGLPGVEGASSELPELEPVVLQAPPSAEGGALPESIFEDIAIGMETIANAPRVVVAAPPVDSGGEGETPVETPQTTEEVAFVGSVISPNRRIAVLRIGNDQVWIPEGEERRGIAVHEVERDHVRLERDGRDFELERGTRKRGSLTRLAASSPAPRVPQGNVRMPQAPAMDPQAQAEMEAMKAAEANGEMVSEEGTSGDAQERIDRIRRAQERARERALRRGEQR